MSWLKKINKVDPNAAEAAKAEPSKSTVQSSEPSKLTLQSSEPLKLTLQSSEPSKSTVQDSERKSGAERKKSRASSLKGVELDDEEEPEGKKKGRCCKCKCRFFPCCFDIPLEIAMQGLALIDIIFYTSSLIVCMVFLTAEPFAHMDPKLNKEDALRRVMGFEYLEGLDDTLRNERSVEGGGGPVGRALLEHDHDRHETDELGDFSTILGVDYRDEFFETSTTLGPEIYDPSEYDYEKMSRVYSRIAWYYRDNLQAVDDKCGRTYFLNFLFTHELTLTRNVFEEVINALITAYVMYAVFAGMLLIAMCCFKGYILTKLIIIALWYLQLIPCYYIIKAAILSQSYRLCILQYGIGKDIRGQTLMMYLIVWPLLTFKPYELFIWINYIRKFFNNKENRLTDESPFSPEKEKLVLPPRVMSGMDLSKHHYSHYVGEQPLFRQQTKDVEPEIHTKLKMSPWMNKVPAKKKKDSPSSSD